MAKVTFPTTGNIPLLVDKAIMSTRFRTFHTDRTSLKLTPAYDNLKKAWLARADRPALQ